MNRAKIIIFRKYRHTPGADRPFLQPATNENVRTFPCGRPHTCWSGYFGSFAVSANADFTSCSRRWRSFAVGASPSLTIASMLRSNFSSQGVHVVSLFSFMASKNFMHYGPFPANCAPRSSPAYPAEPRIRLFTKRARHADKDTK